MQLEIDKNHKKIEIGNLKRPFERFTIGVLGTTMAISLYSGALIPKAYAADDTTSISTSDIDLNISEYDQAIIRSLIHLNGEEPLTESLINKITFLTINADDIEKIGCLKYFPNLTELSIKDLSGNGLNLNLFGNLPSLKKMFIYAYNRDAYLNSDSLKFIDSLNLDSITLYGYLLYPGCEDRLNKVSEIELSNGFYDIDFSKLTDIRKLDFSCDDVYDYSIYFSKSDYDTLVANGVDVNLGGNEDKFFEINSKLDSIVDTFNIDQNSSDQEKLDEILLYTLENLEYDEYVSNQIASGNDNSDGSLSSEFYTGGYLYGALEKESSICGNYAALVEALINRVGGVSQSAFVHNDTHAWNVVKVDGEPYLVDATWLDGQSIHVGHQEQSTDENGNTVISIEFDEYTAIDFLKSGRGHELRWYMEMLDDNYIESIDQKDAHKDAIVPEYMFSDNEEPNIELENNILSGLSEEVDDAPDITDKKVKIKIGTKEMIITGGALIGVFSALGAAVGLKKKNDRERKRRASSQYEFLYYDYYDYEKRR